MKPSERIAEIRRKIAFELFGIPEKLRSETQPEFVQNLRMRAEMEAKNNLAIATRAIIEFLDELSDIVSEEKKCARCGKPGDLSDNLTLVQEEDGEEYYLCKDPCEAPEAFLKEDQ